MRADLVSPSNALLATRFLLNLDIHTIKDAHQPLVKEDVRAIQQLLASLQTDKPTEQLYHHLTHLADCANHLVNALSEEARERVTLFLKASEHIIDEMNV